MRKTGFFIALLAAATLVACGGGSEDDAFSPPPAGAPDTPVTNQVAALSITTSSPTIPSDGSAPADIKVYAKNANNQFISGVPITFSANSGGLAVTTPTTDIAGMASATLLPAGDPSARTITVTATSGTISTAVNVLVAGSALTVQGPQALSLNGSGPYTVTLLDSGNHGIVGQPVTLTSSRNNTLSAATVTTNTSGQATFNLTAINSGNDTLTAKTLGLTATQTVAVSSDAFAFTAPVANTEVALGATQTVTVNWKINNVPQVGQPVNFTTTRGTVTASTVTDGSGNATATVSASNAGGAVITATGGASTAQLPIEYVASVPNTIDVQASAFSIGTTGSSTVTAVVRDAAGNLVKNKTVAFTLTDVTGGTLSTGSAITNSQGRAQTVYTASTTTSANEGVEITATVLGTAITKTVKLTVARREVFISIGTGNTIEEIANDTQYKQDFAILVTDANGAGVPNVPLTVRLLSVRYYKGKRQLIGASPTGWDTLYTLNGNLWPNTLGSSCLDEDVNRNGQLDAGEDANGSTRLEAGNIASVAPAAITTDATGLAVVSVTYPQEFAYYLDVDLSANTTVQGTEYVRTSSFILAGTASDFNNPAITPPGLNSAFGTSNSCSNPN